MKRGTDGAAGQSSSLIAGEFSALLRFLREKECTFHPCVSLGEAPIPRGVSFRYDIHLHDLPVAHDFLALHLSENIPATFFLLWDYSPVEKKHLGDFRTLAAKVLEPAEIGLHDSPVDAWLIESKFETTAKRM
jgi:hypothetical protein